MNPPGEPTEEGDPDRRRRRGAAASASSSCRPGPSAAIESRSRRGKKTRNVSRDKTNTRTSRAEGFKGNANGTQTENKGETHNGIIESSSKEETEEEYRLRVYGTSNATALEPAPTRRQSSRSRVRLSTEAAAAANATTASARNLSRRLSRQLSRRRSSIVESLPDSPQGWVTLVTTAASAVLAYELRLQKSLTSPPNVFCQETPYNTKLRQMLSTPADKGILTRKIKPSLLVGTRGRLASIAAYAVPHLNEDGLNMDSSSHPLSGSNDGADSTPTSPSTKLLFREVMYMGSDGAEIAIDWEVPPEPITSSHDPYKSPQQRRNELLHGPISRPVIIILHGINNDASFGYIRSLMKACTDRGWIAAGFNFRGCGGIPLKTPRGYTGSFTGDLRTVVNNVVGRMITDDVPLFVVGNSLGANLITKYLGEEGRSGTLPPNVAGGISLGNPLQIHSGNMSFPWAQILGMGVKKMIMLNWNVFRDITSADHRRAIKDALLAPTIGQIDCALAPYMIRNNPEYPFEVRVGYEDGEAYWDDASSYKYVQFVSVPLLKVTAQDDFLVSGPSLRKMSHCMDNPNVFVVKTKCGGHLGWQEAPPDTGNAFGFGTSWADTATTEFIAAVIKLRDEKRVEDEESVAKSRTTKEDQLFEAREEAKKITSRL